MNLKSPKTIDSAWGLLANHVWGATSNWTQRTSNEQKSVAFAWGFRSNRVWGATSNTPRMVLRPTETTVLAWGFHSNRVWGATSTRPRIFLHPIMHLIELSVMTTCIHARPFCIKPASYATEQFSVHTSRGPSLLTACKMAGVLATGKYLNCLTPPNFKHSWKPTVVYIYIYMYRALISNCAHF